MKEIIATLAVELCDPRVTAEGIRKWLARGHVPHRLRLPLLDLAKQRRVPLSAKDFDFVPQQRAKAPKRKRAA